MVSHSRLPQRLLGHRCWPWCGLLVLSLLVPGVALADPIDDYNVAAQFYKDQQWEHAEEAFRRFIVQYPEHERVASARIYEGQSLLKLQKYALARDLYRTFVEKHSDSKDLYLALFRIGECSYFLGEFKPARTELDRFVSAFPNTTSRSGRCSISRRRSCDSMMPKGRSPV